MCEEENNMMIGKLERTLMRMTIGLSLNLVNGCSNHQVELHSLNPKIVKNYDLDTSKNYLIDTFNLRYQTPMDDVIIYRDYRELDFEKLTCKDSNVVARNDDIYK